MYTWSVVNINFKSENIMKRCIFNPNFFFPMEVRKIRSQERLVFLYFFLIGKLIDILVTRNFFFKKNYLFTGKTFKLILLFYKNDSNTKRKSARKIISWQNRKRSQWLYYLNLENNINTTLDPYTSWKYLDTGETRLVFFVMYAFPSVFTKKELLFHENLCETLG